MKHLQLILALLLSAQAGLFAQDSKVTTGVLEYNQGNYEKAILRLEEALSNPSALKSKNLPKAHLYLSMAYLRVASSSANELLARHPKAAIRAADQLKKAQETDTDGKYVKEREQQQQLLYSVLYNAGAVLYNESKGSAAVLQSALQHFNAAADLNTEVREPHTMMGFTELLLGDTSAAIRHLAHSIKMYEVIQGEKPADDSGLMSSVYVTQATLLNYKGRAREALDVIEQGKHYFGDNDQLLMTELSIYQIRPDLAKGALNRFVEAIEKQPENLQLRNAYGEILTRLGQQEEALEIFEQVLSKAPENLQANIYLASHHINLAAELSTQARDTNDMEYYEQLQSQILQALNACYPYMVKLHELQPEELEWINQLLTITSNLGMEEAAMEYLEKQKALR